ncbi:MAG: hypothetical protein EOL87_09470 [Spartobacteria bacterium]|nr:hypothetical protein [Spartobacteria bacterium]
MKKSCDGALMITLVVTMTILAVLGAATVAVVQQSDDRSMLMQNENRAFYLAKAGVSYAKAHAQDLNCTSAVFTLSSTEQFLLTVTNDGSFVYITSEGRSDVGGSWQGSTIAQATVEMEGGGLDGAGDTISDNFDQPIGTPGGTDIGPDGDYREYQAGWDVPTDELEKSDTERLMTTEQEIETSFGWDSSDYLTFQNFTTVNKDGGYIANLVPSSEIAAAARDKDFHGIWGNASDNIYVVGEDGIIVHYDGVDRGGIKWSTMTSPTTKLLRDVWGTPSVYSASNPEKMVAVGNDGEMLEYTSGSWSRIVNDVRGLYCFGVGDNYSLFDIYAVFGSSWNHVSTYGDYGTNPYKWNGTYNRRRYCCGGTQTYGYSRGTVWRPWHYERYMMFKSVWEYYDGRDYNIFGCGNISYSDYGGFVYKEWPSSGTYLEWYAFSGVQSINAMWGTSLYNVYAVGDDGKIFKTDNVNVASSWRSSSQTSPTTRDLNGVYGGSEDYIFAAGDAGTIIFNDGTGWDLVLDKDGENVMPNTLNSVWGSERTGIYAVGDNGTIVYLGYPANAIGGYALPISNNEQFTNHWADTKYLSYSIQTKVVWGDDLDYAASGFNFRWHREAVGKYGGYGVSFMRYDSSENAYNDLIPDSIKPGFHGTDEKDDRLLIVLWKQLVVSGEEQRTWLAYKDVTDDTKMRTGNHLRDLSTIMARVEEGRSGGVKMNYITLYYGNASDSLQAGDTQYDNTTRKKYNPEFATGDLAGTTLWPPYKVTNWAVSNDYFTVVDDVSVAESPSAPATAGAYWEINSGSGIERSPGNSFTLRDASFTSPPGSSFGSQEERPEIALHVYGDVGDYGSQSLVSFSEFRLQLGVHKDD